MNRQAAIQFLKRFGAGVVIGIGSIVPGVSGGVLAVTMGLYERILEAITHFFRAPRHNAIFLLPFGLGAGFGILAFSNALAWLMSNYGEQILFLFIGFVVGGIPSLLRKANSEGFKARLLLSFAAGLAVMLLFARMELLAPATQNGGTIDFVTGLICGFILAVGTIVPGLSTSFILMYMGTYESILNAISVFDIPVLMSVGIGFVLGTLMIIKAVSYLFECFHAHAYYAVLGLLVGSILLILPPVRVGLPLLINLLLFTSGNILSYILEKNSKE